jgi:uncharacterized DUF497 family protein
MEFEWDPEKEAQTIRVRGISFGHAAEVFSGPIEEWEDLRRDYGERRFRALGMSGSRLLHVVYTRRDDVIRIISVRPANRKERSQWRPRG